MYDVNSIVDVNKTIALILEKDEKSDVLNDYKISDSCVNDDNNDKKDNNQNEISFNEKNNISFENSFIVNNCTIKLSICSFIILYLL